MKQFKIRCSQIGKIMTNPRSKSELLSKTTMDYVQTVRKEEIYGRKEEIYTKQMDKGIQMEVQAIELACDQLGWVIAEKNEKNFENEFMTGTPDVVLPTMVADIKCPCSCFTFPIFENEPDKNYWWQLQGYMELTGKDKAQLVSCLMDLPEDLLEKEVFYKTKGLVYDPEHEQSIRDYFIYSNVPVKYRIKVFEFEKDPAAI